MHNISGALPSSHIANTNKEYIKKIHLEYKKIYHIPFEMVKNRQILNEHKEYANLIEIWSPWGRDIHSHPDLGFWKD